MQFVTIVSLYRLFAYNCELPAAYRPDPLGGRQTTRPVQECITGGERRRAGETHGAGQAVLDSYHVFSSYLHYVAVVAGMPR